MTAKIEMSPQSKRKLAILTAGSLVKQCDGKPGEIIYALQQAMDGEPFGILVANFRQLPMRST
jgi:hypothetical protein